MKENSSATPQTFLLSTGPCPLLTPPHSLPSSWQHGFRTAKAQGIFYCFTELSNINQAVKTILTFTWLECSTIE